MATRPQHKVAISIIAKAPIPGFAKTRLIPALGPEGAANLQRRLTAQTVTNAYAACYGAAKLGPVTLWVTPDDSHPSFGELTATHRILVKRQPDGDLGVRMLAAMQDGPTVLIGTDCPVLTPFHLQTAAAGCAAASMRCLFRPWTAATRRSALGARSPNCSRT